LHTRTRHLYSTHALDRPVRPPVRTPFVNHAPSVTVDCQNMLGEGPVWCPHERALWWVDSQRPTLWRWDAGSGQAQSWELPKPPGSFALLADGGLLIAFR